MRFILLCGLLFFPIQAFAWNLASSCSAAGQYLQFDNTSGWTCTASPQRPLSTVGGLPSCVSGIKGAAYMVTDALTPVALATVAAGGAASIGVTCNGTIWIVQ